MPTLPTVLLSTSVFAIKTRLLYGYGNKNSPFYGYGNEKVPSLLETQQSVHLSMGFPDSNVVTYPYPHDNRICYYNTIMEAGYGKLQTNCCVL